jgi:hypothetical protein
VNQPLSEPWHKLCSQSSCCERTIRVTGPAAPRLLGRRRDVTQQKHLRHNNIRAGAEPQQRTALTTVAGASWRRIEGALVAVGYAVLRMKYAA